MYKLIIESEAGTQLTFNSLNADYTITNIQGLSPADATINTNTFALMDGVKVNSSKVNTRTLDIAFVIGGNVEANRLQAYRVLQPKKKVRIYYQTSYVNVFIDGYVQSVNVAHFDQVQTLTTSILCPSPYWKDGQEIVNSLSNIVSAFVFPFASTAEPQLIMGKREALPNAIVKNDGTAETGLTFELYARGIVHNPKIYNYVTQEFIGLEMFMEAGDLITITTDIGNKKVTLLRDGVVYNWFNTLMQNITWLKLPVEGAVFVYTAESGIGYLDVTIKHYNLLEGV